MKHCCEEVRILFPWYVEGCLSTEEGVRLAEHVAACSECARDMADAVRVRSAVRAALSSLPRAGDEMWERVEREAIGRRLAELDVGSFWLGLRLGAWLSRREVPVRADLKLLGREVRLYDRKRKGGKAS